MIGGWVRAFPVRAVKAAHARSHPPRLPIWLFTFLAMCVGVLALEAPDAIAQPMAQHRSSASASPLTRAAGTASAAIRPAGDPYGLDAMSALAQLPELRLRERMGHLSSVAPDLSNADWNNYLYTDSDGGKVIFDEQGPGVIYRLHITLQNAGDANTIYVKVYLDGATAPQIDESIAVMGAGTNAPFLSPLVENATVGSGGYTFYLPIPYAKSARVSLSGTQTGLIYWQTDWRSFPPGTPIQTWTGAEDSSQVRSLWTDAGAYPDPQAGDVKLSGTTSLPGDGQSTVPLADLEGPQEISAITLKIAGVGPARGAFASILDDTHIRIYWDNEVAPSVDAPLGSFFGMGYFGAAPTRATAIGMLDDGTMYTYFPMPFRHHARIELVNETTGSGDTPVPGITYTITHRPFTGSFADVGYFRTQWTPQTVLPGQQADFVHWLDVSGAGQVVGIVESRASTPAPGAKANGLGFLEGNVNMWVDGSKTPAWRDNGTEDTFDGGYYFDQGPVENPNAGDNIKTSNAIAAYRVFIGDPIPFRSHITITDQPGGAFYPYYSTDYPLVFYYSQQPRMVQSDSFSVGDATAAAQHQYQVTGQTGSYSLTSTYDALLHPQQVAGQVNAQQGSSQFVLQIDLQNRGVVLRRSYDQGNGSQDADVYVDGNLIGPWYQAYRNNVARWAQDDFTIPAADTQGKRSITVQLCWVSGNPAWNEAGYSSYSIEPALTDRSFITEEFLMLFGGTLPPETIPYTTVFRQHIYQIVDGKVIWPSVNGPIPERWPSLPAGVAGFFTLYPNPDDLLAGKLDGNLERYLAGAQPGSMLTTFAEADADAATGGQFAPLGLTAPKLWDVHARMQALCANANVRYGSVASGYSASSLGWSARGLDFYGLDIYEPSPPGIMNALKEWRRNVSEFQPDPSLCIAETNTSTPARRPFWFSAIFGWLKAYEQTGGGVPAMCTYWNPVGPLSGPWLPGDTATVEALSLIARAAP